MKKPTSVSEGHIILSKNFTREDRLAPTYIWPYAVYDTRYPNVKIKRGNKYLWFHLNDCKIVPEKSPEFSRIHLEERIEEPEANPMHSTDEYTNIPLQTEVTEDETVERVSVDEMDVPLAEQSTVRRSTRICRDQIDSATVVVVFLWREVMS